MDQNPLSQTNLSDQSGRMENHINMGLKLILREDLTRIINTSSNTINCFSKYLVDKLGTTTIKHV